MTVMRIVSVATGKLVSSATLADDGTVTYEGDSARSAVARWLREHPDASEADAVEALKVDGWSNGYIMVELPEDAS